jgi:hypothetical protein
MRTEANDLSSTWDKHGSGITESRKALEAEKGIKRGKRIKIENIRRVRLER